MPPQSYDYKPTQEVARSTETGAATNIIYGLALGYKSAIIPITILSIDVFVSFEVRAARVCVCVCVTVWAVCVCVRARLCLRMCVCASLCVPV